MSKRIGEILIERGLITTQHLDQSIKAQLIFGGHLGTNLIELGFIDEHTLGEALAESFGVEYATSEMLDRIPPHVVGLIPDHLAEKHNVIPLKQENKTLHLAMIDPKNLAALDELSFVTGRRIVPWITPEMRIFQALERYYNLPRRPRYITLCQQVDGRTASHPEAPKQGPAVERVRAGGRARPAAPDLDDPDEPDLLEMQARYGYGRSWQEVLEERGGATGAPRTQDPGSRSSSPGAAAPDPASLDDVADRVCRAEDTDGLAAAVLTFIDRRDARGILFKIQGNHAMLWDAVGHGALREKHRGLRLPVVSGSVFELLLGQEFYRGPVPDAPIHRTFYDQIGGRIPSQILMIPVHLNDRLVAILHVDSGSAPDLGGDTGDYLRLVRKLSLGMNLLILKKRIRAI